MKWNCHIPGKQGTDWEGGFFPLTMEFSEDYPTKPPKVCDSSYHMANHSYTQEAVKMSCHVVQCRFPQGFFHPNIYPSGTVCLSILNEVSNAKASVVVRLISSSTCCVCC